MLSSGQGRGGHLQAAWSGAGLSFPFKTVNIRLLACSPHGTVGVVLSESILHTATFCTNVRDCFGPCYQCLLQCFFWTKGSHSILAPLLNSPPQFSFWLQTTPPPADPLLLLW